MEKLKALFGTEALTWEQLEEKLKDNEEVKLANLAGGEYVAKRKYEDKVGELKAANDTISGLRDTVAKFDGVDVEGLKQTAKDLEDKYNTDMAAVKLDNAVNLALVGAKVKNPKLAKAAIDMSIVKLDGENLLGLSEQLNALRESDGYLFDTEEAQTKTVITGGTHNGTPTTDAFMSAFMKGAGLEGTKGE
jgi:hypothetical protein